jgi:hypothetical protein
MTPWPWAALRICSTATAVLMFNQAVFAGQFLAGSFGALHTHRVNATAAGIAVLVTGVAAVLVRLRGGGPRWPAYACLGLFGLVAAQIAMGFARVLAIHVPLGVTIIALTLLLTGWSWRASPRPAASATSGRDHASGARAATPGDADAHTDTDAHADPDDARTRTTTRTHQDDTSTCTEPRTDIPGVAARADPRAGTPGVGARPRAES